MATDLTKGTIWKKLLLFAVPLLISSLVQQLYNTVDLIFTGNFVGTAASSAIGASSLLITCLVGFFGGMSVGSGVVVSQFYGAGDQEKVRKAVHNAVALSIVGGAIFMVVGYLFAPYFLQLMNTPAELHASATGYLRIYFFSFIAIMLYNMGSGALRAMGDSKTPLYAQIVGGVLNVVLDGLFIAVLKLGVNGVAWATLLSQAVAAGCIVWRLTKLDSALALRAREIRFHGKILKSVIGIGVPAGTQSLVITLSNIMAQYHINSLGIDAIFAFTAYFKVELVIYLPIVAFGQAIMTFSGQCTGAKDYDRIRKGTRQCLLMAVIVALVCSAVALGCGQQLFRVFAKDQEVIDLGLRIIHVTFPFYFIYVILQVLGDSLRGMGRIKQPMLIVMIHICMIRTALLFFIAPVIQDVRGVAVTYPITWALTAACMAVYYTWFQRNRCKQMR